MSIKYSTVDLGGNYYIESIQDDDGFSWTLTNVLVDSGKPGSLTSIFGDTIDEAVKNAKEFLLQNKTEFEKNKNGYERILDAFYNDEGGHG